MVKYELCVQNDNDIKKIDLNSILNMKNNNSLELIDKFTELFYDENELKEYLIKKKLLSSSDLDGDICIIYKYEKIKTLPIFYSSYKKYLKFSYLSDKLNNYIYDIDFLKEFLNYLKKIYVTNSQSINIIIIQNYVKQVEYNYGYLFESESLENAINNILKSIIGRNNYKDIRTLSRLLYTIEFNKIYQYLSKINCKRNQFSESNLSSDGDPDFPYNSEEELMYNKYIERLNRENNVVKDEFFDLVDKQLKL